MTREIMTPVHKCLAATIVLLSVRPAVGGPPRTSFVGKAGPVQMFEFEKKEAVCYMRLVTVRSGVTNATEPAYLSSDYGHLIRVGVVKQVRQKLFVSAEVSNESTYLEADYTDSLFANNITTQFIAPRKQSFSDSEWTKVYEFAETAPPASARVEFKACKGGKPVR